MALSEVRPARVPAPPGEGLRIDTLSSADIEAGLALSDAAGWNQTADDWALFIERGRALGCRDGAGRLVATAAALPYGEAVGWISMVLVAEGWRHRGLASALMRECIRHLQARNALPLLDATPDGAAVYVRLGFARGFAFERWQSSGSHPIVQNAERMPRQADARDLDRIAAFDLAATGFDRRFLLESFLARPGTRAWLAADGRGFVIARGGRRATQIGPLIASSDAQAIALLGAALQAQTREVFIDVPTARRELAAWLESQGLRRQRSFVRMSLGGARVPAADASTFALAGPEFG